MNKKIIVIGGGFAGLSAATSLAAQGFQATVLEGRQVLGGRAYSFKDSQTGDSVDNGQHLLMGCYRQTQEFLKRIGALEKLKFQMNLSVDFAGDRGRRAKLRCWPLPSPLHLLSGLLRLSTLSWGDRFRLIYIHKALKQAARNPRALEEITVDQWLKDAHQSERVRRHLWDLITIAALNESPQIASAAPFATVLAQAFFDTRKASQLGLATVGLSDLYVHDAVYYLRRKGSDVALQSPVAQLEIVEGRVTGVELRDGRHLQADWVVSAVSAGAFLKLFPEKLRASEPVLQRAAQLKFSPIISIHLWFDRAVSRSAFVGLLDTHIQWLFNKRKILKAPHPPLSSGERVEGEEAGLPDSYVSLVISGAHPFIEWSDQKILTMALEELRRIFPKAQEASLVRSLVIKEHQATLSPTVGSEALRPEYQSPFSNLLIAGDWTRTGLPATIESACVSGHACADIITQRESQSTSESKEVAYA